MHNRSTAVHQSWQSRRLPLAHPRQRRRGNHAGTNAGTVRRHMTSATQRLQRKRRYAGDDLRAVTRARAVVAAGNSVMVRATDELQLLQDMCGIVVTSGGYRAAWV